MNKQFLVTILLLVSTITAHNNSISTEALHKEIAGCKHQNLNEKDHPTIFKLVKELTIQANVGMPKYISTYSASGNIIVNTGVMHRTFVPIEAYFDLLGDLHICYDILTDLSYNEIQGVIALALAKSILIPKAILAACATLGGSVGLCYFLNTYYKLELSSIIKPIVTSSRLSDEDKRMLLLCSIIIPVTIAAKMSSNYLQKSIDMKAAAIADANRIIDGIIGLQKVREKYVKENFFSRMAKRLNIKKIFDTVFYPLRSFNDEERIAYLKKHEKNLLG